MNGFSDLQPAEPVIVVSPHLDDGVFSCGQLLASRPGSVVITAMAGGPAEYGAVTGWDHAAGFSTGDDVVASRRTEDRAALRLLGARAVWLDFSDAQYGNSPAVDTLARALDIAISSARLQAVFIPMGLFHSDHKLTHAAALQVMAHHLELRWFAYEDAIYRTIAGLLDERLEALKGTGIVATFAGASSAEGAAEKRRAVRCYNSQLRALATPGHPGSQDAFEPERYWRLSLAAAPTGSRPASPNTVAPTRAFPAQRR